MSDKTEKQRMAELVNSLENNTKINLKESTEKKIDEGALLKETEKFKKNLRAEDTNKDFRELIETYMTNAPYGKLAGGQGKTVNTFIDTQQDITTNKSPKPEPQGLMPEEALGISIKRCLRSGVPVNDLAFYDEVNWNLMNLGFPAKNSVDIKNYILKLVDE